MFLAVFVCLSVCLLARLLKNARTDFDEMLRVDRCRERTNLLTSEPDPDHPDARTGLLSPTSYNHGAPLQRAMVLKWFYLLSRRNTNDTPLIIFLFNNNYNNTFVGGKCALPSAIRVIPLFPRNLAKPPLPHTSKIGRRWCQVTFLKIFCPEIFTDVSLKNT